ncbi:MAG: FGGY-family carbohydrate kinase [Clostridia bacterium]|nr:FGGY-family carbohydrate kinase [Clostridia bacterium]
MQPVVLTFDIGTQSARALIIDNGGEVIAARQEKYTTPFYSLKDGYAEQNPNVYWQALVDSAKYLSESFPDAMRMVSGVTVTTMRDSCICLDKDGKPLRDFILWMDTRRADVSQMKVPFKSWLAFNLVGMMPTIRASYEISRSNWIAQNEKEIWDKTECFILLSGYINYKLTGRLVDSFAGEIGHIPLDYKRCDWKSKNDIQQCVFNVPREKLCELVPPGTVIGNISRELHELTGIPENTPVIASGADKGCETLGCGVLNSNSAAISLGTSATIEFSVSKYIEAEQFLPSYPAITLGFFNPEVQIYRGYWMLRWFIDNFATDIKEEARKKGCAPEQLLNEQLIKIPAGCDGLLLQPYWAPLLKKPNAKGTVVGFHDRHTRMHLYRAIIEGIAFALYDAMLTMEKRNKKKITRLVISGGGSVSDEICQIVSDVFGLPVYRIQTSQASCLGAAICAFVGLNIFMDSQDAVNSMVRFQKPFTPTPANTKLYHKIHAEVYKKIFPSVSKVYDKQF